MNRPLPKGKYNKFIGVIKDALGRKILKEFLGLRPKTYSYLINHGIEDKKAKVIKKCAIKKTLKFEDYKSCLEANQLENKINHLEKNKIDVDSLKNNHK